MATNSTTSADATRQRLLDATAVALDRFGLRKLSLTDIAGIAGVSRPTLYRYFRSKDELLVALALHEKERFASELAAAVDGLTGAERLDRTIRFMVEFQRDYPMRGLVVVEPAFTLDQLERARREMTRVLVPLLDETFPAGGSPAGASPAPRVADLADLIVRITMSHFLIRGDDAQLLRELRHVAGLDAR